MYFVWLRCCRRHNPVYLLSHSQLSNAVYLSSPNPAKYTNTEHEQVSAYSNVVMAPSKWHYLEKSKNCRPNDRQTDRRSHYGIINPNSSHIMYSTQHKVHTRITLSNEKDGLLPEMAVLYIATCTTVASLLTERRRDSVTDGHTNQHPVLLSVLVLYCQ